MERILNLQLFAEVNTNVTTDAGLAAENKTFYDLFFKLHIIKCKV